MNRKASTRDSKDCLGSTTRRSVWDRRQFWSFAFEFKWRNIENRSRVCHGGCVWLGEWFNSASTCQRWNRKFQASNFDETAQESEKRKKFSVFDFRVNLLMGKSEWAREEERKKVKSIGNVKMTCQNLFSSTTCFYTDVALFFLPRSVYNQMPTVDRTFTFVYVSSKWFNDFWSYSSCFPPETTFEELIRETSTFLNPNGTKASRNSHRDKIKL